MKYILLSILFSFATLGMAQIEFSDCANALSLCEKKTYQINSLSGGGAVIDETGTTDCYGQTFPETNVTWFKWTTASAGSLEFSLSPKSKMDDLDFVLFRANTELNSCQNKTPIRCMASGINFGLPVDKSASCSGATGLRKSSMDTSERAGCAADDDNYLQALSTLANETYYLFVNNLSSNNGFTLEFGGSTKFKAVTENCAEQQITASVIAIESLQEALSIGEVFPNPSTNDFIYLMIQSDKMATSEVSVYDLTGQEAISTFDYNLIEGEQTLEIDTKTLSTGSYLLEILMENEKVIRKFVVVNDRK